MECGFLNNQPRGQGRKFALALTSADTVPASSEAAPDQSSKLGLGKMLAFIAPALPVGALGIPLSMYLPPYYSGHVGLSLAAVGFAFFLVRTLDIGFDPLVGLAFDRTRSRWGQCRPWLVVGGVLISLGCVLLFFARPGASTVQLVGGLLVLYAGYSIVHVAHPAWAARIAPQYDERSRVYAWLFGVKQAGTLMILGTPAAIAMVGTLPPGGDVHLMGWCLALAMPICLVVALSLVREPPAAESATAHRARFSDYVALLRRPSMVRLVTADVLTSVALGCSTALFIFFWRAQGVSSASMSVVILLSLTGSFASVPLWMAVARKIGKHQAWMVSCLAFAVVLPSVGFLPADRLDLVGAGMFALGLTTGTFLIRAMVADAADEVRLHTGLDRTGQAYALLASTEKAGMAVAVGVTYAILEYVGFKPSEGAANAPSAIHALKLMYLVLPALTTLAGAFAFVGYKLNGAEHARIRAELERRDRAAAIPAGG
jgi:glycoside/pentoside/hexuronide:cation symporter, GPH family